MVYKIIVMPASGKKSMQDNPRVFEKYVVFCSLPRQARETVFGYWTDKEFSERNGISKQVLRAWRRSPEFWEKRDAEMLLWGKAKTPDVLHALLKRALKQGQKPEVELWLKFFENWKEKLEYTEVPYEITLDDEKPSANDDFYLYTREKRIEDKPKW